MGVPREVKKEFKERLDRYAAEYQAEVERFLDDAQLKKNDMRSLVIAPGAELPKPRFSKPSEREADLPESWFSHDEALPVIEGRGKAGTARVQKDAKEKDIIDRIYRAAIMSTQEQAGRLLPLALKLAAKVASEEGMYQAATYITMLMRKAEGAKARRTLKKGRVYLYPHEKAPAWAEVKTSPRGARYYEGKTRGKKDEEKPAEEVEHEQGIPDRELPDVPEGAPWTIHGLTGAEPSAVEATNSLMKKVQRDMEDYFKSEGLPKPEVQRVTFNVSMTNLKGPVGGGNFIAYYRNSEQHIVIGHSTTEFIKKLAQGEEKITRWGGPVQWALLTLAHEVNHAVNPISSYGYTGVNACIEEALTEIQAPTLAKFIAERRDMLPDPVYEDDRMPRWDTQSYRDQVQVCNLLAGIIAVHNENLGRTNTSSAEILKRWKYRIRADERDSTLIKEYLESMLAPIDHNKKDESNRYYMMRDDARGGETPAGRTFKRLWTQMWQGKEHGNLGEKLEKAAVRLIKRHGFSTVGTLLSGPKALEPSLFVSEHMKVEKDFAGPPADAMTGGDVGPIAPCGRCRRKVAKHETEENPEHSHDPTQTPKPAKAAPKPTSGKLNSVLEAAGLPISTKYERDPQEKYRVHQKPGKATRRDGLYFTKWEEGEYKLQLHQSAHDNERYARILSRATQALRDAGFDVTENERWGIIVRRGGGTVAKHEQEWHGEAFTRAMKQLAGGGHSASSQDTSIVAPELGEGTSYQDFEACPGGTCALPDPIYDEGVLAKAVPQGVRTAYGAVHTLYKADEEEEKEYIVGGYASPQVIDKEHHLITKEAMREDLPRFLAEPKYRNAMLLHSNVQVGEVLPTWTHPKTGQVFKTEIDDIGLFCVIKIRTDKNRPPIVDQVIKDIEEGKLASFSISGDAPLESRHYTCQDGKCFWLISKIVFYEITVCELGVNQDAKLVVLSKSADARRHSCLICGGQIAKADTTLIDIAESKIHQSYTEAMDRLRALGHLTRKERIDLSDAITDALDAFRKKVESLGLADREVPADDAALLAKGEVPERVKLIARIMEGLGELGDSDLRLLADDRWPSPPEGDSDSAEALKEKVEAVAEVVGEQQAVQMLEDVRQAESLQAKAGGIGDSTPTSGGVSQDYGVVVRKSVKPWEDKEVLSLVQRYAKYVKAGAAPQEAYDKMLEDAPPWFGTSEKEFGYFLINVHESDLPIPNIRLRLDPVKTGKERAPDPQWTALTFLDAWLDALKDWKDRTSTVEKGRVYLYPHEKAPKWADVKEGRGGARYYEGRPRGKKEEPKKEETSEEKYRRETRERYGKEPKPLSDEEIEDERYGEVPLPARAAQLMGELMDDHDRLTRDGFYPSETWFGVDGSFATTDPKGKELRENLPHLRGIDRKAGFVWNVRKMDELFNIKIARVGKVGGKNYLPVWQRKDEVERLLRSAGVNGRLVAHKRGWELETSHADKVKAALEPAGFKVEKFKRTRSGSLAPAHMQAYGHRITITGVIISGGD